MLFYVYSLIGKEIQTDWSDSANNFPEKEVDVVLKKVVVNDAADNITIGGYDSNRVYRQFDSNEAYYAAAYFQKHLEWKLRVDCCIYDIPEDYLEKFKVISK